MIRFPVFALIIFIALIAGIARAEPAAYGTLNSSLTDQVVIPAYEQLAEAMADLNAETAAFCAQPSSSTEATAKKAFNRAMDAWQRAQPIALGPATWAGRNSRIQFWPDKRGTAARQVRRSLEIQDAEVVSDGGLRGKSVALQSMATYELLIYDFGDGIVSEPADPRNRYACALAAAIAKFQAELAAQILADWLRPNGYRDIVIGAAEGNEYYNGSEEVAAEFLKSLSGTLDQAIQLKLERPLGQSIDDARPKRAESWRSDRSLDNIVANLETAQALYSSAGGFGDLLSAAGSGPLDTGLRRSFDEAIEAARAIETPLHTAVSDETERRRVEALLERLKALRVLIGGLVANEIGLVVGFNSMDGD